MNRADLAFLSAHARAEVLRQMAGKPNHVPDVGKMAKPKGGMNKWESAYSQHLDAHRHAGTVRCWHFEAVKFRLADRCWFCPDFLVQFIDGSWEIHEVKGFWRDDAKVKVKVMAEAFPFPLIIVSKERGGMGWTYERVSTRA